MRARHCGSSKACSTTIRPARRARRLAAECLATANEQDARERRFTEVLQAAQQAVERRQWPEAIRCAEESLTISPDEPARLPCWLRRSRACPRTAAKGAAPRAGAGTRGGAIEEERFSDAERALTEAAAIDPEAAALADARQQLESARQQAAENRALWQRGDRGRSAARGPRSGVVAITTH
jgi:hypothetical protein